MTNLIEKVKGLVAWVVDLTRASEEKKKARALRKVLKFEKRMTKKELKFEKKYGRL